MGQIDALTFFGLFLSNIFWLFQVLNSLSSSEKLQTLLNTLQTLWLYFKLNSPPVTFFWIYLTNVLVLHLLQRQYNVTHNRQ